MAPVAKKAVSKKPKAVEIEPFDVEFTYERSTKGTHVYAENGDPADQAIGKLYIKKSQIGETAPKNATISISFS